MTHVILGLLMLWPQSLYDLTKNFRSGISLFYSASTGSIKRALDRLLADGLICVEPEVGPRGRKTYAITDAGRKEFSRWMRDDLSGSDLDSAVLPRAFFLGLLDPGERPVVGAAIERRVVEELDRLERLEEQATAAEVPEEFADVAHYQLATLQFGLASCRTALDWVRQYLPRE